MKYKKFNEKVVFNTESINSYFQLVIKDLFPNSSNIFLFEYFETESTAGRPFEEQIKFFVNGKLDGVLPAVLLIEPEQLYFILSQILGRYENQNINYQVSNN